MAIIYIYILYRLVSVSGGISLHVGGRVWKLLLLHCIFGEREELLQRLVSVFERVSEKRSLKVTEIMVWGRNMNADCGMYKWGGSVESRKLII